jgi:hypothetical protein
VSAGVGEKRQLLHASHHQKASDFSLDPRFGSKFSQNSRASQNFSLHKAASEPKASEVALCPGRNGPRAPAWIAESLTGLTGRLDALGFVAANVCKLTQPAGTGTGTGTCPETSQRTCIAISGVKSLKRFAMSQIGRLTPHYQHGNCRTPGRSVMHKANQLNQALAPLPPESFGTVRREERRSQPLSPASKLLPFHTADINPRVFPGLVYRFWQPYCIRISRITSHEPRATSLWRRSPSRHSVALASFIVASR